MRLLVPGRVTDVTATRAGGRRSLGDSQAGGLKIFEYGPTMLHAKTMVLDGTFAALGSANVDQHSFG